MDRAKKIKIIICISDQVLLFLQQKSLQTSTASTVQLKVLYSPTILGLKNNNKCIILCGFFFLSCML